MTKEKIKELWPEFQEWIHKTKGFATAGGFYLIALWYEYLSDRKKKEGK